MIELTTDTDKELIQQIRNLRDGMVERMNKLLSRGYHVTIETKAANTEFAVRITKTEIIEEIV